MAVEDTLSDIRLEQQKQAAEIINEANKNAHDVISSTDARTDALNNSLNQHQMSIADRLYNIGRESADNRAQITSLSFQVRDGFTAAAKDAEINALKTQVEASKNTTYLSDKITNENEKTRALISDYRDRELNRLLVERNADLVGERWHAHHWRYGYDNAQWNALQSNLNAFQSQLQETRQGMVNFGTMAGVGQTSTSNNVR